MVSNDEIREFADNISTDTLPRDEEFQVMAARPTTETEPVTQPIKGYYHAKYVLNEIQDEMGYAGVSFHLEEE
jgi:hypothetical protein